MVKILVDEGVEPGFASETFVNLNGASIWVVETEGFAATEQGVDDAGLLELFAHVQKMGIR